MEEDFCTTLKTKLLPLGLSLVCDLDQIQIMSRQRRMLSLCGFIVIVSLLQGSVADSFSSVFSNCSVGMYNQSKGCASLPTDVLGAFGIQHALTNFDYRSAMVYILIDLVPLTVFPLLILFNFNLASGPAQSFVFICQVTPAAVAAPSIELFSEGRFIWGILPMQSPINDIVFPQTLPFFVLQYCKLVVVLLVAVTTVVLVKCIACPCASWRRPWAKLRRSVRHFRRKHAQRGTVMNGLCSIAIFTYGFVIQQAFIVLRPAECCLAAAADTNSHCLFYCSELEYSKMHSVPFILGALMSLVLVLPLPLLLLYYPCVPALMQRITKRSSPLITCHKLAPVFDVFQSAYKPKLRFFAAFPLLYRLLIWMLFNTISSSESNKELVLTLVFILILTIHSLVQPYSEPRHNYIETLYLVNLVLISVVSAFSLNLYELQLSASPIPLLILIYLSAYVLPILIGIGYIFWRHKCCKRCRVACCKRCRQSRTDSGQEEYVPVLPSEAYLDLDEVASMEQTIQ